MKALKALLLSLIVFTFVLSPTFSFADHTEDATQITQGAENSPTSDQITPANEESSSGSIDVASLFWPIVPGTTAGDGMFWAKQLKENIGGMFIFNDIDKAKNYVELSEKRMVEANKLVDDADYGNAVKSLEMSSDHRDSAIELKRKAVEAEKDTLELTNLMVKSFEKQKQVLGYFSGAVDGDENQKIDEDLKNIELQISEAK